jgi:hypothetical protein
VTSSHIFSDSFVLILLDVCIYVWPREPYHGGLKHPTLSGRTLVFIHVTHPFTSVWLWSLLISYVENPAKGFFFLFLLGLFRRVKIETLSCSTFFCWTGVSGYPFLIPPKMLWVAPFVSLATFSWWIENIQPNAFQRRDWPITAAAT